MNEPLKAREQRPPPTIPGYRIDGVLGSGATSVVYRATQTSIERVVALKVLHAEALRSARAVRRLQREARTAARLKHPNIISAIDMGRAGDTWWFAMELVEGESLEELFTHGGRFTERRALEIFIPLCRALQYASEHGVVHRDIKPANILIEADGRPRLVDLGLARVEDDPLLTRTGATLGTPHYISPEQARDPVRADTQSDLWSIGASMFHCVTGRPPFDGTSAAEIMSSVLYGRVSDPRRLRPDLSRGLTLVLRKCLSRDREKRYFTADELRADLERVRDRKAPAIKVTHLEPLDPRTNAKNRRMIAVATTAVVLLAALIAWHPWSRGEGGTRVEHVPVTWVELATLERGIERRELTLHQAWSEQQRLCAKPRVGFARDCEALRMELIAKLSTVLSETLNAFEAQHADLLEAHEFEQAGVFLDAGLSASLLESTGFAPVELPPRFVGSIGTSIAQAREELKRSRARAFDSIVREVRHHRLNLWGQIDRMLEDGAWDEVRELLPRQPLDVVRAAGADPTGFRESSLAEDLAAELRLYEERSLLLESQWRELDSELLDWMVERFEELEADVNARRKASASELFRREYERRLAERGLDPGALPTSFEARFHSRFEKRHFELARLEDEILERDAGTRLGELDAEADLLRKGRRYEDLHALWAGREVEEQLQPLLRSVELRREEALVLAAFMDRALRGVVARDGEPAELWVGTFERPGTLRVGRDPERQGFELEYSGGNSDPDLFLLHPGDDGRGHALDWRDVEAFAEHAAVDEDERERDLQLVLFRFAEGEYEAASKLLEESELSDEDYLVFDLRIRLRDKRHEVADERVLRREDARRTFESLTTRKVEGDAKKELRRVDELLTEYADVLEQHENDELRSLRLQLRKGPEPTTLADFKAIFGPQEVSFDSNDVVMEFEFLDEEVGAWERGDWYFDNGGWIHTGRVGSLEELVRARVPRLKLPAPFELERGRVDVRVEFFQPQDSPQDLLVLSAGGFHAVLTRGVNGGPPTCHVDTGELGEVIAEARKGKGHEIEELATNRHHEIGLSFSQKRGQTWVTVNGVRITETLGTPPGIARRRSVSFRSLEPLRLTKAVIRGPWK